LEQLVSETSSSEYQRKKRVARLILDALLADGIAAKVSPEELRRAVRRYYATEFAIAPAREEVQNELLTRQRELESIWQASLLKSPLIGKVEEQNATLLEIARLERGTLFIPKPPERNVTPKAARQSEWLVHRIQSGEHSFLVVFHQDEQGQTEMVLIEGKAFEERLSAWRKSLVNNNESREDLLWISRQLSPLLNNVNEHVQIVGDPVAYEVPWSALLVGEQRLVECASVAVSHTPAAKRPQIKINRNSDVLLVGDVRFPSDGPLDPLPFTREEVLRIATHFESPTIALGATPTRKWTLDTLAKTEVAHLATHGVGRSTVQTLGQGDSPLLGEAPFLGSGLLLAGVSAEHADLLTAATVASLQLPQLKLVVLSACESGVTAGSEAAYALPRAFHLAGCQTVVSTQWPVDDRATSVLMQLFYANLVAEQVKPAEAMRQAQLTVLRHPGRLDELAKLRGPDFAKAAKRLNKNAGTKKGIASPRLWAGFIVSHGGRGSQQALPDE
jgi:CHAT domain-containing protein